MFKVPKTFQQFKSNWLVPRIQQILCETHCMSSNIARIYANSLCANQELQKQHPNTILNIIKEFSSEDIKTIRQVYEMTKFPAGYPIGSILVSNTMEPIQQSNLNAKRVKKSDSNNTNETKSENSSTLDGSLDKEHPTTNSNESKNDNPDTHLINEVMKKIINISFYIYSASILMFFFLYLFNR